ncbi:MAG: DUF4116 domain-containing protein [Bacilli bacterium]|nr:DUF4116 domain-containing protein [Bacilli bacterium]
MNNLRGEEFLDKLYNGLHMSDEVMHTAENKDSKAEKIHRYMERLERINKEAIKRDNDINNLKYLYHRKYVIKKENLPKFMSDEDKEGIIKKQEESLDKWLNYLLDTNATYPTWAKYWAFQGMLKIGTYDEANDIYQKRSKKTIAPFIEADPEIIAKCIEVVSSYVDKKKIDDNNLEKLVESGNFSKLYTLFIKNKRKKVFRADNIDDGIWITYHHETIEEAEEKEKNGITPEYIKLYNSLQGYNTHWCTAGSKEMAKSQICGNSSSYLGGDFYVYYTKDENGEYKIPRIAIRMDKNDIGEIRGVADESQNVEDGFEEIIEKKIKSFENISKDNLEKNIQKVYKMKKITYLNQKNKRKEPFTEEDILLLYELGISTSCFGWDRDQRIDKILSSRNVKEDYYSLKEDKDKTQLLINISGEGYFIEDFKVDDKKIIIDAIKQNGCALKYANEDIKKDKEIVLSAVKRDGLALEYANESLKKDKEVVLTAVKENGKVLHYADKSLKKDKEIVLTALRNDNTNSAYLCIDDSLESDKDVVLAAIEHDGLALENADENLKKDKEVVLEAVKRDGLALEYADESLKKDKEVVLTAVKENGWALEYADRSMKKNKEVVIAAVNQNNDAMFYADESLNKDKEFILDLINNYSHGLLLFEYADKSFREDKELVMAVIRKNGLLLRYLHPNFKKDKEIVLTAVKQNLEALEYADDSLKEDPEFMKEVEIIKEQKDNSRRR